MAAQADFGTAHGLFRGKRMSTPEERVDAFHPIPMNWNSDSGNSTSPATRKQSETRTDHLKGGVLAPRVWLLSLAVGLASFVATELMHFLLVPNIGRRWERLLAEGVSAIVVAGLTARVIHAANQRREATLLRMQVISEMNHHIRNALGAIALSTDAIHNQQCIRVISESVDHIEWTLREILLRQEPLDAEELERLRFVQRRVPPTGQPYARPGGQE